MNLEEKAELLELAPTLEDVRYLISLIESMPAAPVAAAPLEAELRSAVELVLSELRSLNAESENLQREIAFTIRDLDLEALAGEVMGVLDPLGQLQAWLADQLKALASWFASVAEGAVRRLWDAFIRPALDSLTVLVATARDRVMEVLGDVSRLAGQVGELLSRLGEVAREVAGIAGQVISAVSSIATGLKDYISSALSGFTATLSRWLESIASGVKSAVDALARVPGAIIDAVRSAVDAAQRALAGAIEGVARAVQGLVAAVAEHFGRVAAALSGIADSVARGFSSLGSMMVSALKAIEGLAASLERALRDLGGALGRSIADLGGQVLGALRGFAGTVSDLLGKIGMSISTIADLAAKGFAGLLEALRSGLGDLWSKVRDAVAALSEAVSRALAPIVETVSRGFEELGRWMAQAGKALEQVGVVITGFVNAVLQLPERLSGFFRWISEAIEGVKIALLNFFRDPIGAIRSALEKIGEWIWSALPDWLKSALLAVQGFFAWLWEQLQALAKDPAGFIYNAFKWIGEEIWKHLPEPLKWIIENVQKALAAAWDAVVKFFTRDLPGFFAWLWEGIQAFAKDPVGWLQRNVGEPLWSFAKWLWERIVEGAKWLWEQLQALGAAAWRALADIAGAVWGAVGGALQNLAMAARGAAEAVMNAVIGAVASVIAKVAAQVQQLLARVIAEWARELELVERGAGRGEAFFMLAIPATLLPALAPVYALPPAVSSVSHTVDSFELHGEGSGKPLGIGLALAMRLRTAVLKALKEFGDAAKEALSDVATGFWMGFFVAMWDAVKYLSRASWKKTFREAGLGDLPIEMPTERELVEMVRRLGIEQQLPRLKKLLLYYGLPDFYIEYLAKTEEELHIVVKDRFGTPRRVPLSPLYDWPSISEVAAWAVRDVFGAGRAGFEEYFKWAERMGVPRDLAVLQYVARFKYPPPGAVWSFAARAMAGLAWYTPSAEDMATSRSEAEFLGVRPPLPPTALNFQVKKLLDALSVYMTWHDLANIAWLPDWTSDNWMVIDTLADIPGRIDVRWMSRFGLMDFMASKGIGLKTPASGFTAVVETTARNPALLMDLTLMSRLVQATGLHPYYVPIVAVAETINAFADERTLLRTGIVDLYERGLADLGTLDDLMANLSVLSFKVAYIDMQAGEWREGYVNVPLSFLPAERKLIEMRAVIDRYLGIYAKALTEIVGGVRSLVLKPETARARIEKFGVEVAKALSTAMKTVIGRDVAFKPDSAYLDVWLAYAQLLVDVETAERLRTLTGRIGGWLLYRVASGHVTDEELRRIVELLRAKFYMTDAEADALFALAAAMRDIAKREPVAGEVLPSLSTLAVMAEYIEVPLDYVQRILAERRVEKTYAELWLRYMLARTVSSEVNTLAGTYRRIVEHFGLPPTLEEQVKALMRAGGWTEREIQIFDLDLYLRRAYRVLSTFVPTLRQFAGDAMYLGEWEKLLDDLLKARGLDAEKYKAQVEYYRKLIKSRKLWRRVSALITELVNCYAEGVIDERTLRSELSPLRTYGLDDAEIEVIVKTAKYRAARYAARR